MSNIPILRLHEMIHSKPLIMDEIYPEIRRINARESAYITFRRILILGAVKTGKTDIYLP